MRFWDTHCHLFMEPLAAQPGAVLERCRRAGVERLIVPSIDRDSFERCIQLRHEYGVSTALGIHPWQAHEGVDLKCLREKLSEARACAIGEIGLDWKADTDREVQRNAFISQLKLAGEMNLPVILHCRAAFEEMLDILSLHSVRGAVHAWSRPPELMERFLDRGLFISFGGAVTRPGARGAARSASRVPADRFIIETDAPSIGMHGIPSGDTEPAHVPMVAAAMAEHRGESVERIAEQAWRNSTELFGEPL